MISSFLSTQGAPVEIICLKLFVNNRVNGVALPEWVLSFVQFAYCLSEREGLGVHYVGEIQFDVLIHRLNQSLVLSWILAILDWLSLFEVLVFWIVQQRSVRLWDIFGILRNRHVRLPALCLSCWLRDFVFFITAAVVSIVGKLRSSFIYLDLIALDRIFQANHLQRLHLRFRRVHIEIGYLYWWDLFLVLRQNLESLRWSYSMSLLICALVSVHLLISWGLLCLRQFVCVGLVDLPYLMFVLDYCRRFEWRRIQFAVFQIDDEFTRWLLVFHLAILWHLTRRHLLSNFLQLLLHNIWRRVILIRFIVW